SLGRLVACGGLIGQLLVAEATLDEAERVESADVARTECRREDQLRTRGHVVGARKEHFGEARMALGKLGEPRGDLARIAESERFEELDGAPEATRGLVEPGLLELDQPDAVLRLR